jgi:hypothetical protein
MNLLHYGIRGGMDAFSYFAGLIVIIVGFIFIILLAIATNGFNIRVMRKRRMIRGSGVSYLLY